MPHRDWRATEIPGYAGRKLYTPVPTVAVVQLGVGKYRPARIDDGGDVRFLGTRTYAERDEAMRAVEELIEDPLALEVVSPLPANIAVALQVLGVALAALAGGLSGYDAQAVVFGAVVAGAVYMMRWWFDIAHHDG